MMFRKSLTVICLISPFFILAQNVQWSKLSPAPEKISNNAVTTAVVNGVPHVFSFSGIDTTKDWFGIHLRGFRFNTQSNVWDTIAPLPDPLGGKIAAGASTVKNKIYIIGGYHVASNYAEKSSSKVHVYDPETNTFLPDGKDIPVPIDDHIQAVWRDSLIFVVTGWSNTNNVASVQIYNPSEDEWLNGTGVSSNSNWRVFGGSGSIIGDTIYYAGGAMSIGSFPPSTFFRKGYINPEDPTQITWVGQSEDLAKGYRMGALSFNGKAYWLGGSDVTYNFDGIAYNGSGGVPSLDRIVSYAPQDGRFSQTFGDIPKIMDLRGVAQISPNEYILVGGMEDGQQVTDQVLKITFDEPLSLVERKVPTIDISPNPASSYFQIDKEGSFDLSIFNAQGSLVMRKKVRGNEQISIRQLEPGGYWINCFENSKFIGKQELIILGNN